VDVSDLYRLKSLHVTAKPYVIWDAPNGIIYDPRTVLGHCEEGIRGKYTSFFSEGPMDDTMYATITLKTYKTAGEMLTTLVSEYREIEMFSLGPFLAEFHLSAVDFGSSVKILEKIKAAESKYIESEELEKLKRKRHVSVHVSSRKPSL